MVRWQRPLRRADHSFRGVRPGVCLCVCVSACDLEISQSSSLGPMGLFRGGGTPFHMSAKLGVTDYVTKMGRGRSRRRCRGRYLDLRSKKQQATG